jgi:hypothetical protein
MFTLEEARSLLPEVRRRAGRLVPLRADFTELQAALRSGMSSSLGGRPEAKAMEAQIDSELSWFSDQGIVIKGFAPLLLDFPAELDGESVLLCWLEGESALSWYHRIDLGFLGRRPLPR